MIGFALSRFRRIAHHKALQMNHPSNLQHCHRFSWHLLDRWGTRKGSSPPSLPKCYAKPNNIASDDHRMRTSNSRHAESA
jgi:hypothetical protein